MTARTQKHTEAEGTVGPFPSVQEAERELAEAVARCQELGDRLASGIAQVDRTELAKAEFEVRYCERQLEGAKKAAERDEEAARRAEVAKVKAAATGLTKPAEEVESLIQDYERSTAVLSEKLARFGVEHGLIAAQWRTVGRAEDGVPMILNPLQFPQRVPVAETILLAARRGLDTYRGEGISPKDLGTARLLDGPPTADGRTFREKLRAYLAAQDVPPKARR